VERTNTLAFSLQTLYYKGHLGSTMDRNEQRQVGEEEVEEVVAAVAGAEVGVVVGGGRIAKSYVNSIKLEKGRLVALALDTGDRKNTSTPCVPRGKCERIQSCLFNHVQSSYDSHASIALFIVSTCILIFLYLKKKRFAEATTSICSELIGFRDCLFEKPNSPQIFHHELFSLLDHPFPERSNCRWSIRAPSSGGWKESSQGRQPVDEQSRCLAYTKDEIEIQ